MTRNAQSREDGFAWEETVKKEGRQAMMEGMRTGEDVEEKDRRGGGETRASLFAVLVVWVPLPVFLPQQILVQAVVAC